MTAPPVDPDAGALVVRTVPGSDGCTVVISGEIDTRSAPVLGDRLHELLQHPGDTPLELDLRQVTFLDSAGLTTLVGAHRAAEAAGRVLRMRCGTTRAVLRPLQITGLTTVFTLVDPPEG